MFICLFIILHAVKSHIKALGVLGGLLNRVGGRSYICGAHISGIKKIMFWNDEIKHTSLKNELIKANIPLLYNPITLLLLPYYTL